jgi:hypothetical protein
MTFEVFQPKSLADWLRGKLAASDFRNASEVQVALGGGGKAVLSHVRGGAYA